MGYYVPLRKRNSMLSPTYTNNTIKRQEYYNSKDMEKQFFDGIRVYKPNEKAPGFVKASLVIDKQALINWLQNQPDHIKGTIKESGKGNYYLEVDNYKPATQPQQVQQTRPMNDEYSDLPF